MDNFERAKEIFQELAELHEAEGALMQELEDMFYDSMAEEAVDEDISNEEYADGLTDEDPDKGRN